MQCIQILLSIFLVSSVSCQGTEEEARKYLNELEGRYSEACNKQVTAIYNFRTDINDKTKEASVSQQSSTKHVKSKLSICYLFYTL